MTRTTPHTQYLKDTDLAERYQIARNTVWDWSRKGILPKPIKLGHQCTRWLRSEVEARERDMANRSRAA